MKSPRECWDENLSNSMYLRFIPPALEDSQCWYVSTLSFTDGEFCAEKASLKDRVCAVEPEEGHAGLNSQETNISQCVKSVKFLCNGVKLENSAHERKGNVQVIPRREIRLKGDALSTPCLKKHIRQALKFAWFLQHQDISRRHQFKADATNFHANSH